MSHSKFLHCNLRIVLNLRRESVHHVQFHMHLRNRIFVAVLKWILLRAHQQLPCQQWRLWSKLNLLLYQPRAVVLQMQHRLPISNWWWEKLLYIKYVYLYNFIDFRSIVYQVAGLLAARRVSVQRPRLISRRVVLACISQQRYVFFQQQQWHCGLFTYQMKFSSCI